MNPENVLLLGLKRSVTAISKTDGKVLWLTRLPAGMGESFVTVLSDGQRVFAHSDGKLHCLDLENGRILWSNGLTGFGYGIASLCFPGGAAAPEQATARTLIQERQQSAS